MRSFSATKDGTCSTMSLKKALVKSSPRRMFKKGMSRTTMSIPLFFVRIRPYPRQASPGWACFGTFLSRGLGGLGLSEEALPSLDGRPLPGLAALSFYVGGFFYRGSGSLSGRGCLGNVFLIICHLQVFFSWHKKSQSADWPGESDLPSWCYI